MGRGAGWAHTPHEVSDCEHHDAVASVSAGRRHAAGAVHPNLFHNVLELVPASAWQVVQQPDGLHVLLSRVREGFSDETLAEALRRELMAQGAVIPVVRVERVPVIPRRAAGKAALIKSDLSRDHCEC